MMWLFLSAVVVVCSGDRDEFNEPEAGTCIAKCAPGRCNKWAVDSHPCSGASAKSKVSINPWMCNEPRCEDTDCSRCGNTAHCERLCREKEDDLETRGFDMSGWEETYGCRKACAEGTDVDWMCFQDCDPHKKDDTGKPMCYDYWPCSEQYCSRKGKQKCYAMDIAVDPWSMKKKSICKVTKCKRCGAQSHCLAFCNDYNDRETTWPKKDCATECQAVDGYKCIFTPPTADEIEAMEAREDQYFRDEWEEMFGEESWWVHKLLTAPHPMVFAQEKLFKAPVADETASVAASTAGGIGPVVTGLALFVAVLGVCGYLVDRRRRFKYEPIGGFSQ